MAAPERSRPAQELTTPPATVPERYLQYLKEREGQLCTVEDIKVHLPRATIASPRYVREIIRKIRIEHLKKGEAIVTLLSHSERTHGFYYLSSGEEVRSLSELGVSPFRDDSDGLIVYGLSLLSSEIDQNPLIESSAIISLFDRLFAKDSLNRQRPYLTLPERRLMTLLTEHPEGISTEAFLKQGMGVDFPDLARDREIVKNHLVALRRKIKGLCRIYFLPPSRKPGEKRKFGEARYLLLSEKKVGDEIQISSQDREIFSSLPEPVKRIAEELCSRFSIGERLEHSLDISQRRLLYFLASRFGSPCSMKELVEAVYPSVELSQDPIEALIVAKRGVQKALEGSEFGIITIPRCYEISGSSSVVGAYLLSYRGQFEEEKMEIPFLLDEFGGIDARIRRKTRRMCHLTVAKRNKKGELLHRRPIISFKERRVLLALARSFPDGYSLSRLTSRLFPEEKDGDNRSLINRVHGLRKKIEREFPNLGVSIIYDKRKDQYRLEVKK